MTDVIVVAIVGLIVGLATGYIVRAKRRGRKCIGCPDGSACSGSCQSCNCSYGK